MLTNQWKFERVDSFSTQDGEEMAESVIEEQDNSLVYFSWLGRVESFKEDLHKLLGKPCASTFDSILTEVV